MPVVFRDGDLRYYFFANEGAPREPPRISTSKVAVATQRSGLSLSFSWPIATASTHGNYRLSCGWFRAIVLRS